MFERFTESARAVVVGAQAEARGLGDDFIGCEHLLIAVAAAPDGPARTALRSTGVTPESLRSAVQEVAERGPDAVALATIGIDLDEVRRRVEGAFGPGALDARRRGRGRRGRGPRRDCGGGGAIPFTPRSKRALEQSLRAAVARGDRHIGSEHILLGILDAREGVTELALARLGVTPERLRQQLGDSA
jgi:ATP-dependent Clp protease ATP-binding subunit ClpA